MPTQTQEQRPTLEECAEARKRYEVVKKAVDARRATDKETTPTGNEVRVQFDALLTVCRYLGAARVNTDAAVACGLGLDVAGAAGGLIGVICGFIEAGGRVAFIDPPEKTEDTR